MSSEGEETILIGRLQANCFTEVAVVLDVERARRCGIQQVEHGGVASCSLGKYLKPLLAGERNRGRVRASERLLSEDGVAIPIGAQPNIRGREHVLWVEEARGSFDVERRVSKFQSAHGLSASRPKVVYTVDVQIIRMEHEYNGVVQTAEVEYLESGCLVSPWYGLEMRREGVVVLEDIKLLPVSEGRYSFIVRGRRLETRYIKEPIKAVWTDKSLTVNKACISVPLRSFSLLKAGDGVLDRLLVGGRYRTPWM